MASSALTPLITGQGSGNRDEASKTEPQPPKRSLRQPFSGEILLLREVCGYLTKKWRQKNDKRKNLKNISMVSVCNQAILTKWKSSVSEDNANWWSRSLAGMSSCSVCRSDIAVKWVLLCVPAPFQHLVNTVHLRMSGGVVSLVHRVTTLCNYSPLVYKDTAHGHLPSLQCFLSQLQGTAHPILQHCQLNQVRDSTISRKTEISCWRELSVCYVTGATNERKELKTTKGLKSIKILIEIQIMLSNNKIATLVMTLDEAILKYKQNQPLYVVLDSGTKTQLRVAQNWPMNELVRGVDGKMHSIGFLGQTWELLASRANLSVVYTQPEEGEMWGKERNDGNWTGMIGMLQRHEAEVAISTFAMSKRRLNMFIRPQQTTILHWGLYFSPFSPCLWIALLATVMVFGVYVYILQCLSAQYRGVESVWSFTDSQLWVFGTLCGQDQSPAIERDISKGVHLATLTIYFTGMILLAAYSGVLVSHFAVNRETLPFNNLQGFLKDGRYTFGILNQSAELEIFQDAKYGILNTVYRRHIARDSKSIAPSIFKGLLQACTLDKYVFLTPAYLAKAIIPRLPCKLVAVSECIMKSNMAMAVTATSPYHGLFEYILQRLLMGGVLQKLYLGSFSQVSSWHSSWEKVGLEKVAPLLALLAIGCALAVLVLVGELNSMWSKPEQLEQAEKLQTSLLEHQKESMSVQIELLYNGRMLGQILENSQIKLLTVMNEFRASTLEQKQLLFDVFERLSSLQAWVLGEVSWLETVIFYISSAIISYVSTATPRTHSARPGLFVTVTMNAVIERSICTHLIGEGKEQLDTINANLIWWVWLTRRIMIVVCVALLVIAMYNYSDYNAINHRLLLQIQQQNSKIIGQLKNIKSSKIYSMEHIVNKYNIDESYCDPEISKLSTSSKHDFKDPDQKLNCITRELRNTDLESDVNKDLRWNPLKSSENGGGPSPRQTINRLVTVISAMVCACAAQEGEKTVTKRGLAGLGYGYVPTLSYGPAHSYSNQHSLSYAAPLVYSKVIVAAPAVSTVSYHGNYGNGLGYGGVQHRESKAVQVCVYNRLHRSKVRGTAHPNNLEHSSRTYNN
uniref:Uncharacterized protein n=1 Tax=Timema monikensis TaxID=170555 RepID=A0A7R9EEA8_9NEOP|nr:unnamed protein product [Timema monikensis]